MKTKHRTRKPKPKHTDTRNAIRHPSRAPAILAAVPNITPTPEQTQAVQTLAATLAADMQTEAGKDGTPAKVGGVKLAPAVPRGAAVVLLGSLLAGVSWNKALTASGMTWAQVGLCSVVDKDGFGRMIDAVGRVRDSIFVRRGREALVERAVDGIEEPIIGRIDKDLDGQLTDRDGKPLVKRRYSDKLLEFGLARMDRQTFGEPDRSTPAVNIGHQVVYNIQGVPMGAVKPPIEAEATETTPDAGENRAQLPDAD
jgi:hypothetical protein